MVQKQIFFLNNLIITASIIFIIIFFIPIFTINVHLNYKIRENNLVINAENLNMKKKLFMKFENNSIVIGHDTVGVSSIKIEESNIRNGEIILNAQQFNTKNDLKIFYNFKRSIVSYILKNKNMFTNCSF